MLCLLLLATCFVPLVTGSIDSPDVFASATFVWVGPADKTALCNSNIGIRRIPIHSDRHLALGRGGQEHPYESALRELKATRDHDCKGLCKLDLNWSALSPNLSKHFCKSGLTFTVPLRKFFPFCLMCGGWSAALRDLSGGVIIYTQFYGAEELRTPF